MNSSPKILGNPPTAEEFACYEAELAAEAIRAQLPHMTPTQRYELFAMVREGYHHCGASTAGGPCYCDKDE